MRSFPLAALVLLSACSAVAGVFGGAGAGGVTTPDDSCDRRLGTRPEPFCQEITNTLVGLQFKDDCVGKYGAKAAAALCPRANIIGGCLIDKVYEDGSRVTDWFYDVNAFDGGADAFTLEARRLTVQDVKTKCADRARYEDGAHFVVGP
jgi:hypothetical protein